MLDDIKYQSVRMSLKLNTRERPKSVVGEDVEKCYKLVMVSQWLVRCEKRKNLLKAARCYKDTAKAKKCP